MKIHNQKREVSSGCITMRQQQPSTVDDGNDATLLRTIRRGEEMKRERANGKTEKVGKTITARRNKSESKTSVALKDSGIHYWRPLCVCAFVFHSLNLSFIIIIIFFRTYDLR